MKLKTSTQKSIFDHPNIFWQYPNITEKVMAQKHHSTEYLELPWATIIDKKIDISSYSFKDKTTTCCQHIHFRNIIPLCKKIGIKVLYTSHKKKGEDEIDGIALKSCPIYAVNFEDSRFNSEFKDVDFVNLERPHLYSFKGGWHSGYMSSIRSDLFEMSHPESAVVENIGGWHFENVVYSSKQNKQKELNMTEKDKKRTQDYNKLLLQSRFSLCPSGSGPNSVRLWESLACGSIPVLLSDTLELPEHELWEQTIVRVNEKDVASVPDILEKIDDEDQRRKNCLQIYHDLGLKEVKTVNRLNIIQHGTDGFGHQLHGLISALALHDVKNYYFDAHAYMSKFFNFDHITGAEKQDCIAYFKETARLFAEDKNQTTKTYRKGIHAHELYKIPSDYCSDILYSIDNCYYFDRINFTKDERERYMNNIENITCFFKNEKLPKNMLVQNNIVIHIRKGDAMTTGRGSEINNYNQQLLLLIDKLNHTYENHTYYIHTDGDAKDIVNKIKHTNNKYFIFDKTTPILNVISQFIYAKILVCGISGLSRSCSFLGNSELIITDDGNKHSMPVDVQKISDYLKN